MFGTFLRLQFLGIATPMNNSDDHHAHGPWARFVLSHEIWQDSSFPNNGAEKKMMSVWLWNKSTTKQYIAFLINLISSLPFFFCCLLLFFYGLVCCCTIIHDIVDDLLIL